MSEQIKELLKKDFVKIASLSQQTDYTDKEKISKLCDEIRTTQMFCTNFGNRYYNRLQAILKEDALEHKCVLCGKDSGENPVICHQCLDEIIIQEKINNEVQPPVEDVIKNKKADIEEIDQIDSDEKKTSHAQNSSKRLYFLYAVIVILIMIIIKQSIVGDTESGKKNEFSAAQAKEVVEEFYDKTTYKISLQEVSECPKAIFQASQGKQVPQQAWLSSELVGVYAYSIEDEKQDVLGQVWVSFQGEAIQLGMTENEKFIVLKQIERDNNTR